MRWIYDSIFSTEFSIDGGKLGEIGVVDLNGIL